MSDVRRIIFISTRLVTLMRLIHLIKLKLLLDLRIKIKRVNSFELKLNLLITLIIILIIYNNLQYFIKITTLNCR